MSLNDKNDCVIYSIFNSIKNTPGFKNYSIDKIKGEFKTIKVRIENGICFEDLEKWIDKFEHSINIYLFGADYILKCKKVGYNPNKGKMADVIMVCNNNHSFEILSEEIKRSITIGHSKDLNKSINPINNLKFNYFEDYKLIKDTELNLFFDDEFKLYKEKVVILESGESFVKIVNDLLKIENDEFHFIDYNLRVVVFKGVILCITDKYFERKKICDDLNKKLGVLNFNFSNQSYSKIGMNIFKIVNGINGLDKSSYNKKVLEKIDDYTPTPLHYGNYCSGKYKYDTALDGKFCYTLVMHSFKNEKIPVITIGDNWVKESFDISIENISELKNGRYLILGFERDGVKINSCMMSLFMIKRFIKLGFNLRCSGYVETKKYIDGGYFTKFVEEMFKLFEGDYKSFKLICNSFTGLLNKKYESENRGFITKT